MGAPTAVHAACKNIQGCRRMSFLWRRCRCRVVDHTSGNTRCIAATAGFDVGKSCCAVGSPVPPSPAPASDKLSLPQAIQLGAEFASSSTPLSEIDPDTPLPAQDASAPCTPQTSSDQLREVRSSLRGIAPSPLDTSPGESTALTAAMSPFPSAGQISARRGGGSSRDVGDLITPPSC